MDGPDQADRRLFLSGALAAGVATGGVIPASAARQGASRTGHDASPMRIIPLPSQRPAREGVVEVGGARLFYWDTGGSGQAIMLMHPNSGSAYVWGYQQPVFAAAGYRVIGYSRRGFRGSTTGPIDRRGTQADDVAALADHLALDRFHAVGSAAGALTVGAFAMIHPRRLRSMTLACSVLLPQDPDIGPMLARMSAAGMAASPVDFRELGPAYRMFNPDGHRAWLALEHGSRGNNPPFEQPAAARPVTAPVLKAAGVPTLVIAGDGDLFCPPPLARAVAGRIGAELAVLTESGHSGYWERPDQFNPIVLDFIRRHRA